MFNMTFSFPLFSALTTFLRPAFNFLCLLSLEAQKLALLITLWWCGFSLFSAFSTTRSFYSLQLLALFPYIVLLLPSGRLSGGKLYINSGSLLFPCGSLFSFPGSTAQSLHFLQNLLDVLGTGSSFCFKRRKPGWNSDRALRMAAAQRCYWCRYHPRSWSHNLPFLPARSSCRVLKIHFTVLPALSEESDSLVNLLQK